MPMVACLMPCDRSCSRLHPCAVPYPPRSKPLCGNPGACAGWLQSGTSWRLQPAATNGLPGLSATAAAHVCPTPSALTSSCIFTAASLLDKGCSMSATSAWSETYHLQRFSTVCFLSVLTPANGEPNPAHAHQKPWLSGNVGVLQHNVSRHAELDDLAAIFGRRAAAGS